MDDAYPWMVGLHFRATTGRACATRGKTRGALRDEEELVRKSVIIITIMVNHPIL